MKKIFSFSVNEYTNDENIVQYFGFRGRNLMDLAALEVPILPGLILTEPLLADEEDHPETYESQYSDALNKMGNILEKHWNAENPLLVKLVVSPMLNMVYTFSSIHNIGLCDSTIESFATIVGEEFAWHEYWGVMKHILMLELLTSIEASRTKKLESVLKGMQSSKSASEYRKDLDKTRELYPAEIFSNAFDQFQFIKKLFRRYFAESETLGDSAILVQAMTFGNYGDNSFFGTFATRDPMSGKDTLTGEFIQNEFDTTKSSGKPIAKLNKIYLTELEKIAKQLETNYKEIRMVKFNIEDGKLWIIDQSSVPGKSIVAEIRTLLDLLAEGVIDDKHAINAIQPSQISEILHPVIDKKSAVNIPSVTEGISGAMGAAVGKIYFSTDALMDAAGFAERQGLKESFILAMDATYAEDVKAIEASVGVISVEGGYASHAPVVARSLGKVAMVNPGIEFVKNEMRIGKHVVKEGDYVSLEVPAAEDPTIYFGKLDLLEPDIDSSGLIEFLNIAQKYISDFDVHANADQKQEAELALKFLADGIGLCRTEHMFFHEKRIPIFRSLIVAAEKSERKKILSKLKTMQIADFYELFEVMESKPVTIRLLDAPLHEFLPHNDAAMTEFIEFYRKDHPDVDEEIIRYRCYMSNETNPMLGHRGIRMAFTYPDIYLMQVEAIFEAAFKLRKNKGIVCNPEIMIPIVMTPREVKAMRYGKKIEGFEIVGIRQIEENLRKKLGVEAIPYRVGTMIELPSAALLADQLALYADFFSFGTNDLTQTCLGLSRDDFNSFFTDYNEYDLLEKNPFKILQDPVKELVSIAVERGRLISPDINCGLCGEHGAEPENIYFSMDVGLNYVSCSPYGIPAAKIAIAQKSIKDAEKADA